MLPPERTVDVTAMLLQGDLSDAADQPATAAVGGSDAAAAAAAAADPQGRLRAAALCRQHAQGKCLFRQMPFLLICE